MSVLSQDHYAFDAFPVLDAVMMGNKKLYTLKNEMDAIYAKGCDVYVTELQQEVVEINSGVQGVPPFLARYTIDTHHTPAYASGYLANKVQPRLFMTTHMSYDSYAVEV